jgi:hypothetical protein
MRHAPTALLSAELPGAEQVELDCAGNSGDAGLRWLAGGSTVDGMINRTGARGRARYVPDDRVNQRVSRSVTGN